jgi:hypothetical protein
MRDLDFKLIAALAEAKSIRQVDRVLLIGDWQVSVCFLNFSLGHSF